ncbi:MAG: DUF4394 domain-containing protein [Blastocatellia bacterium]
MSIDVNPGRSKAIDLSSRDYLPVAILGAKDFDVASIEPSSLNFAGAAVTKTADSTHPGRVSERGEKKRKPGETKFNIDFQDVNKDGFTDLVASFPIAFVSDLSAGTRTAVLRGLLRDGSQIEGSQGVQASGQTSVKVGGAPNAPATQFCNTAAIIIPALGDATPFPSNISVMGLSNVVTDVTVTLNGVSHTKPDDLEIIVVAPSGQVVILDNGAFDGTDAVNQNLTFSDSAAGYAPNGAPLVTGTYKPVSYFAQTTFGAPAPALTPAAPYGHTLASFHGVSPNGTWSLYARDVIAGDMGSIAGGWCINITTGTGPCLNLFFQGSLETGDTTQTGRLLRDNLASLCGSSGKACPGLEAPTGSRFYDSYTVTNTNTVAACLTASLTVNCSGAASLVVYTPTFNPASLCTNYYNDSSTVLPVSTPISETQTMSSILAPGQTVVLVVHEITPGAGCTNYGLLVEGDLCAAPCTITCPPSVTQANDPNQCGGVVNYSSPTTTGSCGTVTCNPPAGSFFPKGTTTVTCTSSAGPNCTFTVTIVDTQPPTITCPANITVSGDPNQCGAVANYPPPTVSDNCPGVGAPACSPASGSFFPVGTTTITCRVSDASTCANIWAVDTADNLVNFRTTTPGDVSSRPITGLGVNEDVLGIDFRPATGQLFGLVRDSVTTVLRLVTINLATGATAQIGGGFAVNGNDFGFDFNPTVDRIRITSDAETNVSVNPDNGVVTIQTPLNPGNPNVVGSAYTNNFVGATVTTLYGIDSASDMLVTQNPPANGTLLNVGSLGVDTTGLVGFDISQCGGTAYATLTPDNSQLAPTVSLSSLYTINLTNGQATLVGAIGGSGSIRAMSVEMARTSNCTFTVRVNDTQPASITCPANISVAASATCPITNSVGVTFPPPTASDNCPGVTVVCNPPSGSIFPVGTTTVTCTATDATGNTATCSFTISTFSFCLQDETNPSNFVFVNATTGDYVFVCGGVTIATGRGVLNRKECIGTIDDSKGDRRVHIQWDTSANGNTGAGTATVQVTPNITRCSITDKKMTNNTCSAGPPNGGDSKTNKKKL